MKNLLNWMALICIVLMPIHLIIWMFDDTNYHGKLFLSDIISLIFLCLMYCLLGYKDKSK